MTQHGCTYTEMVGQRTIFCHKVKQAGSDYCPHHVLIAAEFQPEMDRKMENARKAKARKAEAAKDLASSPLAAYNPAFEEKRRKAYSE